LALERVYLFRLEPVMLFEEPFQNFHEGLSKDNSDCSHDIEPRGWGAKVFPHFVGVLHNRGRLAAGVELQVLGFAQD